MLIDYLHLRRLIGYIAGLMPIFLILSCLIVTGRPLPGSISDYYYANDLSRTILVGSLCAIGCFLWTYKGYDKDWIPVKITSLSAVGVAFFPTIPLNPNPANNIIGIFHGLSAALTFLTMAYICLFLFTKTDSKVLSRVKRNQNRIYRVCGITMVTALLLIPLYLRFKFLDSIHPMFILETIMVEAFSFAWLVKGKIGLRKR